MLRPPFVPGTSQSCVLQLCTSCTQLFVRLPNQESSELKSEIDTCYFDDFDKPGFTFNRWLLFASFFISSASDHLPESVVPPPAAAAVKVLVLPCQHICGINARVYIIVGIPSFEPPPADA